MRRYRFGRIAALLAAAYVVVAVAFGVLALVTGDPTLLRSLVFGDFEEELLPYVWWVELLVVAVAAVQGWAFWQALRGRQVGEPADRSRRVRLLRAALYLTVALVVLYPIPGIPFWWLSELPAYLLQAAIVWLFFLVLAGVLPRWVRLVALVAGLLDVVLEAVTMASFAFELTPTNLFGSLPLREVVHLLWLVPVLVGQARDPRWSRATVGLGVVALLWSFLLPGSYGYVTFGGGLNYTELARSLLSALSVFALVWMARSAHDLGGPLPGPTARVPSPPAARRPWPLAAVAVALPLIPAAVNLANGMPVWIGPRGAIESFLRQSAGELMDPLWMLADVLVGVGAPAVLVLVAVIHRTRRLLRATMLALSLTAVLGLVSTVTAEPAPDWLTIPEWAEQRLGLYQGLFPQDQNGRLIFGLSPLWYSAALAASALVLFFLYAAPPTARMRRHVLVTALGTSVVLCFLPAADHSSGPVTTAADCTPPDPYMLPEPPPPPTGPRAFICAVREQQALQLAATTPDHVLLAHGRRLCGVYTRKDPAEVAKVEALEKVSINQLEGALAGICPSADTAVKARQAAQDREFAESTRRNGASATPPRATVRSSSPPGRPGSRSRSGPRRGWSCTSRRTTAPWTSRSRRTTAWSTWTPVTCGWASIPTGTSASRWRRTRAARRSRSRAGTTWSRSAMTAPPAR
ncbi:hypothetical protein [Nonomuraea jiangxiensis]|uniref:Uncharacterized protein n=1 Tax=Nonomuraea jiangxiensis TaxID=633440 RepID=A0A1G9TBH3_9ACTN|nr:hypothetical protein [Nonomuraea jiangxiensis]SDM44964.1 hypothetical protein SAMN05421869_14425 [Nonomuraea jiangxiensis]